MIVPRHINLNEACHIDNSANTRFWRDLLLYFWELTLPTATLAQCETELPRCPYLKCPCACLPAKNVSTSMFSSCMTSQKARRHYHQTGVCFHAVQRTFCNQGPCRIRGQRHPLITETHTPSAGCADKTRSRDRKPLGFL
jgi:hypothetical protein